MRVSVVDYGIGNIQSVVNACHRLGAATEIAGDGDELRAQSPERVILPGVGAVGEALASLRSRGLEAALNDIVRDGLVPFLGICVGMHMLAEHCEEFGVHQGMGWISGTVTRLAPEGSGVRLPHVGWNTLEVADIADPVLGSLDGQDVYFVHSYAMRCPDDFVLARTDYHGKFVAAVRRGHIRAVQFHPEKSARLGGSLLGAFLELDSCTSAA
jgi:glutamine amidotransferase